MDTYRISRWPDLPDHLDQFKYRRALVAMSVGSVTRTWLESQAGLARSEVKALLKTLRGMGLLEAREDHDPSAKRGFARDLLARLTAAGR